MALVKLSPFALEVSGKMGNLSFASTKEGTVMRQRIIPKNPNTPAQQVARAAFSRATKAWGNLTTAQVTAWNAFALTYTNTEETTDKQYFSDGFNAFVKLSAKFLAVNPSGTIPTLPPTSSFGGDLAKVNVAATVGKLTFTANQANSSGVTTELLFQKLGGKNRKATATAYKTGGYQAFGSGVLTRDILVPAGFYAAGYRFVNSATGQQSGFIALTVTNPVTFSVEDGGTAKKSKAA